MYKIFYPKLPTIRPGTVNLVILCLVLFCFIWRLSWKWQN